MKRNDITIVINVQVQPISFFNSSRSESAERRLSVASIYGISIV